MHKRGTSLRTPLGRVRGLGSAGAGTGHWWQQRLTAVALAPLSLWFVASVVCLPGQSHEQFIAWLSMPWNAVLMILWVAVLAWHTQLGMQVVLEDYVHHEGLKIVSLVAVKFGCVVLAVAGAWAVLRITL